MIGREIVVLQSHGIVLDLVCFFQELLRAMVYILNKILFF